MAIRFVIFSTDRGASLNPVGLNPLPTTLIDLGEDPIFGDFDPNAGSKGRGSRIETLGGAVDQDFGVYIQDARIRIAVQGSPIAAAAIAAIEAAFNAVDGQFYFTEGVNCWKVKFVKPDGFKAAQNLFWKAQGVDVFSYEILFKPDSKDI